MAASLAVLGQRMVWYGMVWFNEVLLGLEQ